ncbi:alkyl aryl-sulfatase [Hyphodiscus hymeniophilus]|uniref:mRNA turnover protein 4 n=1 Tax=Hyphodiscus hymeniophilus TaxID=353542 RepID=A0A9P6VJI4_9HELO|nr:alkyl aryl-sulfatase [Hyphodiscus hymeniophilus]
MPKSKRAKVVHLTKVDKKGKELTLKLFANVRECLDQYQYCFVFSVENMRNTYLKDVRTEILFFGKTKVMAKALGLTPEEAYQDNTHLLSKYLAGNVGLLFTNREPSSITEYFANFSKTDFARAGTEATREFEVPAGIVYSMGGEMATEDDVPMAHSLEPELRKLGMTTSLTKGKITLDNPYTISMTSQFPDNNIPGPSFEDTADFADADHGFIASLNPCIIKDAQGNTVWNNDEFNFVNQQPCPATVNPKLWRQGQLLSKQGLYRISSSIYQVRGFDISHITFVEGQTGVIVIDPLISCECAAAAIELYHKHRGAHPVKAVIYTHSHVDHFGGAAGILPLATKDYEAAPVPIIAPEYFMEEATSENIFAGPIMRQRAIHMYGSQLPRSSIGQIGVGLGMGTSSGTTSLVPPTINITHTGQTLTIDDVRMVFQMVPNTEAPAELNIYFPEERALLVAECATHALHNIATLRGALVRDAKAWSRYLDETLMLYCEDAGSDVQFGSHGWPTWGKDNIRKFLGEQRDLYAYIHDQTVRQMNQGWNGTEIAERMVLPLGLRRVWHTQGFYGSLSHNIKAIYQRYMTWFDGSAENLWKWPPKEEGARYVTCMGGAKEVLRKAQVFMDEGDLRFAATLLGHIVAAADDSENNSASALIQGKKMLALVFEHLGYGAENATWRNYYLSQSLELKRETDLGIGKRTPGVVAAFAPNLSVEQWLGALSITIDGQEAGKEETPFCIGIHVKDIGEDWRLILSNGALSYRRQQPAEERSSVRTLLNGNDSSRSEITAVKGDIQALSRLLSFASIGDAVKEQLESHL